MKTILHIVTRKDDPLSAIVIQAQNASANHTVEVVDFTESPDYAAVLEKIFTADSVEVW